ncbi:class I SAM-dependent methyltransferase [Luteolibacter sp. AS25]|uniref:class I SAM-dependent methyltransferase n=1 Tax=Luteolibacter sp. AS25 TaxID=3135776 RepID=UPI00398ABE93
MSGLISEVTGIPTRQVIQRLQSERANIGSSVKSAFNHAIKTDGAKRYVYNSAMERFYQNTDSFLYELAIWNMNGLKQDLGRWCSDWISKKLGSSNVLSIGDGMGFECLRLKQAGHQVTYFEVPGYSAEFAKRLFQRNNSEVQHLTNPDLIPSGTFDAMICLDVLEHVPDPPSFVRMLKAHLRPGGIFIVHAPYYMIQANYPTHVASSRQYSGDTGLYEDAGFRVIDGRPLWNPIVLQAPGGDQFSTSLSGKLRLALGKPYLMAGRKSARPFRFIHQIKDKHQGWFDQSL